MRIFAGVFGGLLALSALVGPAQAQAPGVTATEILLGNTAPYSGPASAYATIAKTGIAYFDMVNEKGGIHGRKVKILSLDDGFTPAKAIEQTRKLVESDEVLAIFMPIGTPTSSATQAYLNGKKVPQVFVSSGASRWNQPDKFPWTIAWNADYISEGRAYGRYILKNVESPKIGVLYQSDDYGKDILRGLKEGLGDKTDLIVSAISYELTEATIESQISTLKASGANVFLSATTPKFAAQSIRAVRARNWVPLFILPSVSNSVDPVLSGGGLENSVGILSSSYVKQPTDPQWQDDPEFKAWTAFMDKYYPQGSKVDWLNAYAYGMAYAMHQALEQAGPALTRDSLKKAIERIHDMRVPMLLPGINISVTDKDHGPIKALQMLRFNGKTWDIVGDLVATK